MALSLPACVSRWCASHFSLLVQRKVTKRKHTRAARPSLRYGSAIAAGISGRHIHVPSGNDAHPVRRPSGIPHWLRRCGREPGKSKAEAEAEANNEAPQPQPQQHWPKLNPCRA